MTQNMCYGMYKLN